MRIQVKVVNNASAPLKQIQNNINQISAASVRAAQASQKMGMAWRVNNLERAAKNLQWVGRQIEFNFTLPLVLAGVAATKFANANEAAFVNVRRTYGGAKKDLDKLRTSFELLSNVYGVHQDEVINIGAAWAAAGFQGIALARATQLTLETMIIGQMDAGEATKALITLMGQFQLSTIDAKDALEVLNVANEKTSAEFGDLIDVLTRVGAVSQTAGIDLAHLAAMGAALVPVAGSAETAGNGLKTIIGRLMKPTKEAANAIQDLGLNLGNFMKQTGTDRIESLAKAFKELPEAQQAVAAGAIAGNFQLNRFLTLMRDINNESGNYGKVLDGLTHKQDSWNKKIRDFLTSQPQAFKILTTQLQNALAKAIVPLLPAIIAVLQAFTNLANRFADMDPATQKLILSLLAIMAIIGPLARYIGAFGLVFTTGAKAIMALGGALGSILGVLGEVASLIGGLAVTYLGVTGAIVAAIGAAIVAIFVFRKQVGQALQWIAKNWQQLPAIVAGALVMLVRVVAKAAMAVYHWLSYLNPFARHSPSLVDQVNRGVDAILNKYAELRLLASIFKYAVNHLKMFEDATRAASDAFEQADWDEKRLLILGAAGAQAAHLMDTLVWAIRKLREELKALEAQIIAQQKVVEKWEASLKAVDAELKAARKELDRLSDAADAVKDSLDAAQDRLDKWADTPIVGMRQMSDLIFENEMAQKQLRLEMMRLEDSIGPIQDVRDQLAALEGSIESLRGESAELRAAGAGSDVLGPIEAQINAMEAARRQLEQGSGAGTGPQAQLDALQKQLEELQRKGEMLDLENSLRFDPLTRQIEQASNAMREMPFDAIIAGIRTEQAEVARLTAAWDQADAARAQQQAMVDAIEERREAVQEALDAERQTLSDLNDAYDAITNQIQAMEQAINSFASSAQSAQAKAKEKAGEGASAFDMAAGGDFPNAPLKGIESGSLDEFNKKLMEDAQKQFGKFDLFAPIKKAWGDIKKWFAENVSFGALAEAGNLSNPFKDFDLDLGPLQTVLGVVGSIISVVGKLFGDVWKNDIKPVFDLIGDKVGEFVDMVVEQFGLFAKDVFPQVKKVFQMIADVITVAIALLLPFIVQALARIMVYWKLFWPILTNVLVPIFDLIITVVKSALQFLRGAIQFVLAIITGDWKAAWQGLVSMVDAAWDLIYGIFSAAIGLVIGVLKGLWEGIVDIFMSIWDFLFGHSIIPDIVDGFVAAFNFIKDFLVNIFNFYLNLFKTVWNAIFTVIKAVWDAIIAAVQFAWNFIKSAIETGLNVLRGIWDAAWNGISNALRTVWDTISGIVSGAWEGIKNVISGAINSVLGFIGGMKERIGSAASGMWDGISGAFKGVINTIIRWWNGLYFEVPKVHVPGTNIDVGGFRLDTPNITPLARGGFITSGAQAIVGEGSRRYGEYVIPTDPKYKDNAMALWSGLTADLFGNSAAITERGQAVGQRLSTQIASRLNSAMSRMNSTASTKLSGGGDVINSESHVHIHGDLVLPNIRTGDDAEKLIKHLESLVVD